MASQSIRRQFLICALLEGFAAMLKDQGDFKDDELFMAQFKRVVAACNTAVKILRSEPNGVLSIKEIFRIKAAMVKFQQRTFARDQFRAEHPVSMAICLITDQMAYMKPGPKRDAFERLLHEAENLLVCFDPECAYDERDGYEAACVLEELEV